MALKDAIGSVSAPGTPSPEKRKTIRGKKDKSKAQNSCTGTIAKTRERYPLPSLHLRMSITDISKPLLGKWSQARKGGNDNIEVVRTKSQAGMLRPRRLPTIYQSNSRLIIDPFENPVPKRPKPALASSDSEKQSVIVDLPEPVGTHNASPTSDKHSVVVGIPNTLEITLSSRIIQVEQPPSRFEELNDDASVHELEAVFPTDSRPLEYLPRSTAVVLCEADDPTALPTLEFLQRSFTMGIKQHRPKISLSIPRSKSLHMMPDSGTPGTAVVISPPSPPSSTTLYRSLTQPPTMRYSLISPLTPIDMPRPVRPYSTISVPLFMEASDLDQVTEEVPPLPISQYSAAKKYYASSGGEQSSLLQRSPSQESDEELENASVQGDLKSTSSPSPSEDADNEDDEGPFVNISRSMIKKNMAESINKPLPPEPQMVVPVMLQPLAYKPRQIRLAQSQETLPRSRYSPIPTGKFDDFRNHANAKAPSLDRAIEELEWRLSSIREQRPASAGPRPKTPLQVRRGLMSMKPSRSPPPAPQSADRGAFKRPKRLVVRSNSADHIITQSKGIYEKKTRSCQDLRWPAADSDTGGLPTADESETWYRTASERSSADLSHSVFSDADTDGTCQTEQSSAQEKVKGKFEFDTEKECVINNIELPQAMQASSVPAEVAETVILRIMSNLMTLKDLFATAALNKGFYSTFKRHELYLIKATLFKSSVAAWELREISEANQITPTAYLRQYSVEIYTMCMLKSLVVRRCDSFLRPATMAGLVGTDQARSVEIDAAFWRVWTFCRRFGSTAGEEEDIEAQIDWLNGGQLARQRDPSSSFGIGNGRGLSKSELYDMTELWTCLSVLVQSFHGRVADARGAGIFDNCKVDASRDEEFLLEEWTWYLLTLGPSCILALSSGSFSTAKNLGLTQWVTPAPGPESSRSKFFKKALTRVYEARLVEEAKTKGGMVKRTSKASYRMTKSELARELDRARQTAFAKELKSQRQQSPSKSEPCTFSDERPMSVYSQVVKSLPHGTHRISAQDLATMPKHLFHDRKSRPSSTQSGHTIPLRPQTPVLTSSSAVPSAEDDLPASPDGIDTTPSPVITIEEVADEIANETSTVVDPTDRAMSHLVDVLGFTKDEAKWALTRSENGHGIDVEKAVQMLYHGSAPNSRASSREGVHSPVEVESSSARPNYIRKRTPVKILQQRDSIVTTDEMTEKQKENANIMRMREKSYRVLGIGTPQAGKKLGSTIGRRLTRR
jgi:hypothetical protein